MHGKEQQLELTAIDRQQVFAELASGGLMIASTPELAAQWQQRFIENRVENSLDDTGADVCETPQVVTWHAWLQNLAGQSDEIPLPLGALQERLLWERVIGRDLRDRKHKSQEIATTPAALNGLAVQTASAYRLLRNFCIPLDVLMASYSEEGEALARWIAAMHGELGKAALRSRILAADLVERIITEKTEKTAIDRMANKAIENDVPGSIMLDGFASYSPLQAQLLHAVQSAGKRLLCIAETRSVAPKIDCTGLPDEASEYRFIALRIAALLKENPRQSIAIVVGSRNSNQAMLGRILDATLLDGYMQQPEAYEQAVNDRGEALTGLPMISQLLHLLSLAGRSGADFTDVSQLLFSPALKGFQDEREQRALLEANLRQNNRHYISFKALLASDQMRDLPALGIVLKQLLVWKTASRSAAEWVNAVHGLLQSSGFFQIQADDQHRSAFEVRQLNAFRNGLSSLLAADGVCEKLEWGRFLSLLRQACGDVSLALPVHFPQVSIIPLACMAGLKFDVVFAIGLDEDALPLPVNTQPLLPLAVQREYRLPEATPELAFATSLFLYQQLQVSAAALHVSYASQRDNRELAVSPLLAGVEQRFDSIPVVPGGSVETETFIDAPDVPLAMAESVYGGTSIIKNQSACPFRAFAGHRLDIAPLGDTEPGIEASEKGSLIHLALEFIWQKLASQQALLALDEVQKETLIEASIQQAWQQCQVRTTDANRKYEQQRMRLVIGTWLDIEQQRPTFSVRECERKYRLCLPESGSVQFPVNIKADRMDEDGEGRRILIDYKTGKGQGMAKWTGERMEEPQLPLYAMAAGLGTHDAVAIARVRSGDMAFEGLAADNIGIKGIAACDGKYKRPEDWQQVLEQWRQDINALAAEFVDGRSEVTPRNVHACEYCGLEAVCRIDEIGFVEENKDVENGF
ncbi:MAG: PD-(D/E)XK nuclease family protein [Mariprofundaceae bacterium]